MLAGACTGRRCLGRSAPLGVLLPLEVGLSPMLADAWGGLPPLGFCWPGVTWAPRAGWRLGVYGGAWRAVSSCQAVAAEARRKDWGMAH